MGSDPVIERLEAELNASRFNAWDVETFLADRHRAKIAALTGDKRQQRRQVALELLNGFLIAVGYLTTVTVAGLWLLSGEFPIP